MTSTRWCFTLNNPSEDEEQAVVSFLEGSCRYGIFGREVGESGTPHLQGFLILPSPQRLSYLRRRLSPRAHYETARGTSEEARDYCTKDGDFEQFGDFPSQQGKRSDLDELLAWADEFTSAHGRAPTSPDIAKHQPRAYLKYPRFKSLCSHRAPARQLQFGEPTDWQSELIDELAGPADDRSVRFIVDTEGGKGKTWLCRYLMTNRPDDVQILGIGRKSDLAYIVDETKSVYLFNVGRGQMEFLSYSILEAIKDRLLVSTKYQGSTKTWANNTHVVVFSNEEPDYGKLTEDRYAVTKL